MESWRACDQGCTSETCNAWKINIEDKLSIQRSEKINKPSWFPISPAMISNHLHFSVTTERFTLTHPILLLAKHVAHIYVHFLLTRCKRILDLQSLADPEIERFVLGSCEMWQWHVPRAGSASQRRRGEETGETANLDFRIEFFFQSFHQNNLKWK